MYTFIVVNDYSHWKRVVKNFKNIDIYYSHEYGNLFSREENGELYGVYIEGGESKLFYPFIKRNIPCGKGNVYDIVTPYGYGGPYIEGDDLSIVNFFLKEFNKYCLTNNIITETIRFHPLYGNYKYLKGYMDVQYIRKTTAVDLAQPLEHIRDNYSSMNKRNIKKAKKEGLSCFLAEPTNSNINVFIDMYYETMKKNQASDYYFFKKDYFYEQMKATSISNTFLLFTKYRDEIVAGVMVIVGSQYSHYHLGASRTQYLQLKPNNLLFDFMVEFSKQQGSSFLHFGGGYEENDGLFKFKSSFTNENHYDYFLGKKIHNHQVYKKMEKEIRNTNIVNENFFPIYRGILREKINL